MKIIEIGKVIDNVDPKGFGRVRFESFSDTKAPTERSINYEKWSDNDPFVCSPFLPIHINVVPKLNQSIKIIRYNTDKEIVNQEYVPGPYTSPHNFNDQIWLEQHQFTTYGVASEKGADIVSESGKYVYDKTKPTQAKDGDFSLKGSYGSDVLFTEGGVQMRGGILVPKTKKTSPNPTKYPIVSDKSARLLLKKFTETKSLNNKKVTEEITTLTQIKNIVEYSVNDLLNPTNVSIKIYRIKTENYGSKFMSNVFNLNTEVLDSEVDLIYDFSVAVDDITSSYITLRNIIRLIENSEKMSVLKSNLEPYYDITITLPIIGVSLDNLVHPFYFRPSYEFRNRAGDNTSQNNKKEIITNIVINPRKDGYGFFFSPTQPNVPTKKIEKNVDEVKTINENLEQTFSSLTSDKIFLLSTNSDNIDDKKINFNSLDQYEYNQDDFLRSIEPNTYSLVRGEKLVELIELMGEMLLNHVHNIASPPIYTPEKVERLVTAIKRAKLDIINNQIRIN